jgi:hypothetical protein
MNKKFVVAKGWVHYFLPPFSFLNVVSKETIQWNELEGQL